MKSSYDSQNRTDNRTRALGKPALEVRSADGSLGNMPTPRRPSPEVASLIERLRKLVADRPPRAAAARSSGFSSGSPTW
jgi:hypothetical protein